MKGYVEPIKRASAGCLLVLFLAYVGGATLFYHKHVVDGVPVAHSHPYSQTPDTGAHTHTPAGFATIAYLSALLLLAAALFRPLPVLPAAACRRLSVRKPFCRDRETVSPSLRAPPVR